MMRIVIDEFLDIEGRLRDAELHLRRTDRGDIGEIFDAILSDLFLLRAMWRAVRPHIEGVLREKNLSTLRAHEAIGEMDLALSTQYDKLGRDILEHVHAGDAGEVKEILQRYMRKVLRIMDMAIAKRADDGEDITLWDAVFWAARDALASKQ